MVKNLIVFVGEHRPNSLDGVTNTIVGQVSALQRLGCSLEIWTFSSEFAEIYQSRTETGIVHWHLPSFRNRLVSALRLPVKCRTWIDIRLDEVKFIHLHSVFSPTNNLIAELDVPYVITPHGGWEPAVINGRHLLRKKIWIELKERKLWSKAAFVQGVSLIENNNLKQLPGITNVEYIPNGVDPTICLNKTPGFTKDTWIYFGRLAIIQKGLDRMLIAYAKAKRVSKSLPKLFLAGPNFRDDKEKIDRLISSLKLENEVIIRGPVLGIEKSEILSRASLFLQTSRWEGMPLALLEAMAHSVPCLVTRGTNMAEFIEKSGAGLVAGDDSDEIAQAMLSLEESQLCQMGQRAKELVIRNFTWDSVSRKLLDAYQRHNLL